MPRHRNSLVYLLAGEDESLLIGWYAFLALDFQIHVFDDVCSITYAFIINAEAQPSASDRNQHAPMVHRECVCVCVCVRMCERRNMKQKTQKKQKQQKERLALST